METFRSCPDPPRSVGVLAFHSDWLRMSEKDSKDQIIKRPGEHLIRPSGTGSSLARRGLALLNQGKAKGIENTSPSSSPVPNVGDTKTITLPGGVKMEFCYIPAGEFSMGSPEGEKGRSKWEISHFVVLSNPYWMGKFTVTQDQWRSVVNSIPKLQMDINPSPSRFGEGSSPVEFLTWEDCQEFIFRINSFFNTPKFRLPTEAEWEFACRAGTNTPFSFGFEKDVRGIHWGGPFCGGMYIRPKFESEKLLTVGESRWPNQWGLHNMHGNVWEYCSDFYSEDYYFESPERDPEGPESGKTHVIRGGSWGSRYLASCRSANRSYFFSGLNLFESVGLRLVMT